MAFGTQDDTDEVMNEINMTPLVDVMLVLLIVFIITVPVMQNAVKVDLPRATSAPQDVKPETIRLSVDAQGQYFWNRRRSPTPICCHACSRPRRASLGGTASARRQERPLRTRGAGAGRGAAQRRAQDRFHHRAQHAMSTRSDEACAAHAQGMQEAEAQDSQPQPLP